MGVSQCRTCNLPDRVLATLEDEWAGGKSYPYLSELASQHGYDLPSRTLNNHFIAKHSKVRRSATESSAPEALPTRDVASSVMTATGGEITTAPEVDLGSAITDFDSILTEFGFDPKVYSVSPEGVRTSRWQVNGTWMVSYKLRVVLRDPGDIIDDFEFESLRSQVFDRIQDRSVKQKPSDPRYISVVLPADRQVSKVGSRGGTEELLERCHAQREGLVDYLQRYNPEQVIYGELGDIVEEFNSTPGEKFTNDKSLMKQLEIAGSIVESDLQTIHSVVKDITALTVPSNHSAWRNGKDYLGTPEDDWGIFLMRQVNKMFRYNSDYNSVEFVYPDPWEIAVAVNAFDFKLGFTHGDKAKSIQKTPEWWRMQSVGSSPLRDISVLNTGHFHTPQVQVIGRDPHDMPVWWLLAPTADSGSDWYRHIAGYDSDPGLMVYTIEKDKGFNIRTLEIL